VRETCVLRLASRAFSTSRHVRPSLGGLGVRRGRPRRAGARGVVSCSRKAGEARPLSSTGFLGVLRSGGLSWGPWGP
jgi:hypothetical protein